MRGTAAREPYWPWESRPGDTEPSRSVEVSWSESKDSATQTRAPSFQRAGWSERPARTFSTARRHRGSAQAQEGSRSGSCGLIALSIVRERAEVKLSPRLAIAAIAPAEPMRSTWSAASERATTAKNRASTATLQRTRRPGKIDM